MGISKSLINHVDKETFDKDVILEDIDFDETSLDDTYEVVFEDDKYKICKPLNEFGLVPLSSGTRWLTNRWEFGNDKKAGYDDVDFNSWIFKGEGWKYKYVILDKNNPKKKWMFTNGYGDLLAPSGARYSCATWVSENGSREMWQWFLDQKFPFISTNLDKKVGAQLAAGKTVFNYPEDADKLSWYARNDLEISEITFAEGTKKIKSRAFQNLKLITEVTIPEGVTAIGSYAFYGCRALKKVNLPSTIKSIGNYAFGWCDQLEEINLPEGLTKLGNDAFAGTNIKQVPAWPSTLKVIPDSCFYNAALTSVMIPEGVTEIRCNCFRCDSLQDQEQLIIPRSVKKIDEQAFSGNYIKYIFIPNSVEEVGGFAFAAQGYWSEGNKGIQQVIECEAPEKPSGWNDHWDAYSRTTSYSNGYWSGTRTETYHRYNVEWGVASPKETIEEAFFEEPKIESPHILSDEQEEALFDLLVSIPDMSEEEKKELFKTGILNVDMDDSRIIDSYIDSLSSGHLKYALLPWAKGFLGKTFFIAKVDKNKSADLPVLSGQAGETKLKQWMIDNCADCLCVSEDFINKYLGVKDLSEDIDFDVTDVEKDGVIYKDSHWMVTRPMTVQDFMLMSYGTNWYEERNRDNYTDWRYSYRQYPTYYIFTNLDTGEKFLYDTKENYNTSLIDSDSRPYNDRLDSSRRRYHDHAADYLAEFLKNEHNTEGLTKWCIKKWGAGLAALKSEIRGKELVSQINGTVLYKSPMYDQLQHSGRWWSDRSTTEYYIKNNVDLTIKFPRNTQRIENNAFYEWRGITEVKIPETVKYIGETAFCNCEELTKINIPSKIVSIGDHAFANTKIRGDVFIPATCTSIGESVFRNSDLDTIYCEVSEKPEGWSDKWCRKNYSYFDRENANFNVVWGASKPVHEDLNIDSEDIFYQYIIPEEKKPDAKRHIGSLLSKKEWQENWDKEWRIEIYPEVDKGDYDSAIYIGKIGLWISRREIKKLLRKIAPDKVGLIPEDEE